MHGMTFHGFHGVLEEEQTLGQKFIVDTELSLCLQEAGTKDNLEYTVSYAEIFTNIQNIVETQKFSLLEALAETIAKTILKNYNRIQGITVTVKKPQAPISGVFDYFAVSITRKRNA